MASESNMTKPSKCCDMITHLHMNPPYSNPSQKREQQTHSGNVVKCCYSEDFALLPFDPSLYFDSVKLVRWTDHKILDALIMHKDTPPSILLALLRKF